LHALQEGRADVHGKRPGWVCTGALGFL
jgi:hypothetical protein